MGFTVLVTAATGKTGRRVTPQLVKRGVTVRAASRNPTAANTGVEPVRFDWLDGTSYPAALAGVDAVYLVSRFLVDFVTDPVEQVGTFLHDAADAGVRRIVLLSAFGAEHAGADNPLRSVELLVEGSGMASTILRPGTFMQNFSENHMFDLVGKIRERGEITLPGGRHPVSYVSTHDIASVAALALTEDGHAGKEYTLTGPAALTLAEVAEHISAAAGRQVRYVESGPEPIHETLHASGAPAGFAEFMAHLYIESTTSGAMAAITDHVATVTGRHPTTFAAFAAGAADAWRG
ncbi:MAG: NmrA family NAD(P)-binding protein [Actinobacteria bacterium]|nr:NmrA family NAD(P)-binding protein [Actinomycetota bacterium]MBI3686529.1 NmrA family NAD(P)-binding protein [Actinomycetota bacterium]